MDPKSNIKCPYKRQERRHRKRRRHCDYRAEIAATQSRRPRSADSHQQLEKARKESPLASRTVKELISVVRQQV